MDTQEYVILVIVVTFAIVFLIIENQWNRRCLCSRKWYVRRQLKKSPYFRCPWCGHYHYRD